MDFLEKNLEDIIFETDNKTLHSRGLFIEGKKRRQIRLGNYGIADIITHRIKRTYLSENYTEPSLLFNVLELKKDKIDAGTLLQATRYCKGLERYIQQRKPLLDLEFKVTLIGKEVCHSDFIYLADIMHNLNVYTYKYEFDGIRFRNESRYFLSEEGFNNG